MDHKEAQSMLHKAGFTAQEIQKLTRLRQRHLQENPWLTQAAHRRLEFVRWLVANGKLSDELFEAELS